MATAAERITALEERVADLELTLAALVSDPRGNRIIGRRAILSGDTTMAPIERILARANAIEELNQ